MNASKIKPTILIDSREQTPFEFPGYQTQTATLNVGDYSVAGLESVITIERKSLLDFVACCGRERDRFQRDLDRMRGWPVSAVIIESTWIKMESGDYRKPNMKMTPNHLLGSLTSWIAQGHCIIVAPKLMAQRITQSILCHAIRHRVNEVKHLVDAQSKKPRVQKHNAVTPIPPAKTKTRRIQ